MKKLLFFFLYLNISLIVFASGANGGDTISLASSSETAPDYSRVFDSEEVQRIDLIIDADIYSEMNQNMTEIYGPKGDTTQAEGIQFGQNPPSLGGENPEQEGQVGQNMPPRGELAEIGGEVGQNMPPRGELAEIGGEAGQNMPPRGELAEIGGEAGQNMPPRGEFTEFSGDMEQNSPHMAENMAPQNPSKMISLGSGMDPDFFEATLVYEGMEWEHIGIRYKGNSTLQNSWSSGNDNLPLRFNFDYYEEEYPETKNQRFFGFKKLTMANMLKDQTLIHEKLASDLFRESGVAVASNSLYEVYLDKGEGAEFLGLYTMVEDPSDAFLEDRFGNNDGKLYKPESEAAWLTYFDESLYEDKLDDSEDFSEILALIAHLNNEEMESSLWRERLEELFDVESFISYLAVNNSILNWDSYGVSPHNFYLYSDPEKDGQITFIPWDLNECFTETGKELSLSMDEIDDSWPLIYRIMKDDAYKQLYYQKIQEFVNGPFSEESITGRLEVYEKLVEEYTLSETGRSRGRSSMELSAFIENRREAILQFLDEL